MRLVFNKISIVIISLTMFATTISAGLLPSIVSAQTPDCEADKNATILGLPKWYKYLEVNPDASGRCSPTIDSATIGGIQGFLPIGVVALEFMLRLGGLVAVAMIFVAAFKYITSQGNPDNAAAARKTAINALIGLVIIIVATSLVSFLGTRLST